MLAKINNGKQFSSQVIQVIGAYVGVLLPVSHTNAWKRILDVNLVKGTFNLNYLIININLLPHQNNHIQ